MTVETVMTVVTAVPRANAAATATPGLHGRPVPPMRRIATTGWPTRARLAVGQMPSPARPATPRNARRRLTAPGRPVLKNPAGAPARAPGGADPKTASARQMPDPVARHGEGRSGLRPAKARVKAPATAPARGLGHSSKAASACPSG